MVDIGPFAVPAELNAFTFNLFIVILNSTGPVRRGHPQQPASDPAPTGRWSGSRQDLGPVHRQGRRHQRRRRRRQQQFTSGADETECVYHDVSGITNIGEWQFFIYCCQLLKRMQTSYITLLLLEKFLRRV